MIVLKAIGAGLDALFNRHRLVRRLTLLWAVLLITWAVWYVFTKQPDIKEGTAAALATVVGILTVVIGFYQWDRRQSDKEKPQ